MPGTIRRYRGISDPHPLLGFGGRNKIASGVLLASEATSGGVSEQQTITITGTPAGGTFLLTYRGVTTTAIAFNASAATVVAALEALSSIGAGNVTGSGGALPGTAVVITFAGELAKRDVALMTANGAALTGGTTPAVAVTETVKGSSVDSGILVVKRGVILKKGGSGSSKLVKWVGGTDASTLIVGVLARTCEFVDTTAQSNTDVPFYQGPGCTFNLLAIAAAHATYATGSGAADFATWAAANGNRAKTPASL